MPSIKNTQVSSYGFKNTVGIYTHDTHYAGVYIMCVCVCVEEGGGGGKFTDSTSNINGTSRGSSHFTCCTRLISHGMQTA